MVLTFILIFLKDIQELTSQTNRYDQYAQKELDKKRPGILKDSSFTNNPLSNYGKQERTSDRQSALTAKDKISPLVPFSTRNQNIPSESSLVKFYSPNGISQTQFAFGTHSFEYTISSHFMSNNE